jgi:hypothetical protein
MKGGVDYHAEVYQGVHHFEKYAWCILITIASYYINIGHVDIMA